MNPAHSGGAFFLQSGKDLKWTCGRLILELRLYQVVVCTTSYLNKILHQNHCPLSQVVYRCLRKKLPSVSLREMNILGFDGLAKQKPVTLEEARAQAKRLHEGAIKDIHKMTLDEKRSCVSYIVRLADGRAIAQQGGIENLFDEYLEDIKTRLPKIDRREWVFLRIQEFASRKYVTDEEKKLHEEYLSYGGREETFEQYIQQRNANKKR